MVVEKNDDVNKLEVSYIIRILRTLNGTPVAPYILGTIDGSMNLADWQ